MRKTGWLVCRTFIEKRGKESKSLLFSYLPSIQKEKITTLMPPSQDVSLGFDFKKTLFEWTHYSWFAPFLRTLSENDIRLFISALEITPAEHLRQLLKISAPLVPLSLLAKSFFREKMGEALFHSIPDLLPLEGLPKSNLSQLLTLNSEEFRLLSEFLGLHDLALEMRQIIDNAKLKQIYSTLSKQKEFFLKMLIHKKEPIVFKRIEISHWNGQKETLLNLIFQRGLNRLAKALYPEDPSLIWYVKHRMELEEAQLLSSFHKSLEHSNAYSILSRQITEVIAFLQKINPPLNS